MFEFIDISGVSTKQEVVRMVGDGGCLFHSLSHCIYGNDGNSYAVRTACVAYAFDHWETFEPFSCDSNGTVFGSREAYRQEMILPTSYGSSCEIKAASELYPFTFEVYRNSQLLARFGSAEPVKRLRFSGELGEGHYDVYQPVADTPLRTLAPSVIKPVSSDGIKKRGRPLKVKRGRPKLTVLSSPEAVSKPKRGRPTSSSETRKEQLRKAATKYQLSHPEIHRDAVTRYSKTNPEVNRDAVERYSQANPEVNREAVARYTQANPDVNREAVARYTKTHPEVHREAVARYSQANPDVNREAVARYSQSRADSLASNRRIRRALPINLRKFTCIADKSGDDLNDVKPLKSDTPSLLSNEVITCKFCSAPLFFEERNRTRWCCGGGDYHVHVLPSVTAAFYSDKVFLKNSRSYNNLFAFSAIGTTGNFQTVDQGVSFVKVQGRIYHRLFDLSYDKTSNNTALYINDEAERFKLGDDLNLNQAIIRSILDFLKCHNPLIKHLRLLSDHPSSEAHLIFENTSRRTHGPVLGDAPIASELSALISTSCDSAPRQVAIWKIGESKPHTVSYLHPSYEALQYPLIFPHGSSGWHVNLMDKSGKKKVSQVKYYRHKLLSDSRFSLLRRLSQEYLVDMWCRTEEERLQFLRFNQKSIMRIATRSEIDETIAAEGGVRPGKVYLPSSFTHGPRYMLVKYHDAMAIVTRLGRPSFFLTVTCNPRWTEITSSLLPGQSSIDRPDLCDRVFQNRLQKLMVLINGGTLFGKLVSMLYVIEFQKRGLPHAHLAFRVVGGGPVNSTDIDAFVRCTIPPADEANGRLRELVFQHMLHGPCGLDRPTSPCMDMETKRCSKRYPKAFQEITHTDEKGYVHYKRPSTDSVTLPSGRIVTNQWVVPYNAAVLLLMESHCNLEVATGVKIIKYLYKYIYKGPDHAKAGIANDDRSELDDEIESYVNFRYVSASEAAWRVFEFDLCRREPNVIPLPVHLPNEDAVIFRPGQEQEAQAKAYSKLAVYLNRPDVPELQNLTYLEFFERYNVESKRRENASVPVIEHPSGRHFITKRVRGECVARIHFISPNLGELFFLRMLLLRFACKGYEDLRTVDGVVQSTFQKAASARGLLNDQDEYKQGLMEASVFKTGRGLRQFFFALLISGAPVSLLWDEIKDLLCEDFLERLPQNKEQAYVLGLCELDRLLRAHGRTLLDFGLPDVPDQTTELGREAFRFSASECDAFVKEWEPKLNPEQRFVYNRVVAQACGEVGPPRAIFIDGPAGTGKTILLNAITAKVRSLGRIVLCTATTGIAALNHSGGITAHSMFRLPLKPTDASVPWGVSNSSQRAELIRHADVVILDEAPMAHKTVVEILERGFKDLHDTDQLFGGKLMVFAGDFRQIPPIVQGGSVNEVIAASLKNSNFWPLIAKVSLSICQRAIDDPSYFQSTLAIGEGRVESRRVDNTAVIPLAGITHVETLKDLIDFVFAPEVLLNPEECCQRAILSGTNDNIRQINDEILERLDGVATHSYSADYTVLTHQNRDANQFMDSVILNSIHQSGVPDHDLKLKVGAVVILIRNLSFLEGLVNGTKLIIVKVTRFYVEARVPGASETVLIPRILFQFTIGHNGIEMMRRQFPLKLAYGLTINKSQGQTLSRVGVDLRNDVFSHGQLYVALGRVRHANAIKVLVPPERIIDGLAHTSNIVYRQLL